MTTTRTHRKGVRRLIGAGIAATALLVSACSAPGSQPPAGSPSATDAPDTTITAPVTAEQVAALGDVTLTVWADQGEQTLMDIIVPAYEKTYPNVKVDVQFKSYNDLVATVLNAMNSPDAPDVTQGNQGWATDGALVKAGLIRPLDDVAQAYGYTEAVGAAASQLQWSPDGSVFGSGSIYGMSPDNQMVGVFYNKEKLAAANIAIPTTFAEFEAALTALKAAGETPIMLGNSDKAGAMQAFSVIQGAFTPAADTVSWITGADGADFNTDANRQALELAAKWAQDGMFSAGYDGTSPDDAAAAFANGEGAFFIGGNWHAGTITDASKFGLFAAPTRPVNEAASSGSFGMPWHVSSKSDATLAALAFVGMINEPASGAHLASVNRVPVHAAGLTAEGMMADLLPASEAQLSSNGALYWYDWATPTMFDTFTAGLQEVLAGRTSASDMLTAVQDDWNAFQAK
jgi:raffinose/stachyose/melibiose transport system substrate-binding protein